MKKFLVIPALFISSTIYSQSVEVVPSALNTEAPEYAPCFWNNGLVYISNRFNDFAITWTDETGSPESDFYFSPDEKQEGQGNNPLQGLNTKLNEGPASFTADGKTICFTRTISSPKSANTKTLGLFFSNYENGNWSPPLPFGHNAQNGGYAVGHPAFGADGNDLYYSSDMDGGLGGMDIWKSSRLPSGEWSEPINLGPDINSPGNEIFPYVDETGVLYISSDRNPDTQDFDVYRHRVAAGSNGKGDLVALELNTTANEYGFISRNKGREGYFTSDRSGNDDLYYFKFSELPRPACTPVEPPVFCYEISDERVQAAVGLPFKYTWDFGDGNYGDGLVCRHCYDDFGSYAIELNVVDTTTNQLYAKVSQTRLEITRPQLPFVVYGGDEAIGEELEFAIDTTYASGIDLNSGEWDFGDGETVIGPTAKKMWFEPGFMNIQVTMEQRIPGGEDILICVSRMIEIPDTSALPLANQSEADSTLLADSSTELKQAINSEDEDNLYFVEFLTSQQRVPFSESFFSDINYEITERYSEPEELYKYSVGKSPAIVDLYPLYQEMKSAGYEKSLVKDEDVITFREETIGTNETGKGPILMSGEIFFEKNSWSMNKFARASLDDLAAMMKKDEGTTIRIRAYADPSGTSDINQVISNRRATSVQQYLISQGIAPSRISAKGLGVYRETIDVEYDFDPSTERKAVFELMRPESSSYEP